MTGPPSRPPISDCPNQVQIPPLAPVPWFGLGCPVPSSSISWKNSRNTSPDRCLPAFTNRSVQPEPTVLREYQRRHGVPSAPTALSARRLGAVGDCREPRYHSHPLVRPGVPLSSALPLVPDDHRCRTCSLHDGLVKAQPPGGARKPARDQTGCSPSPRVSTVASSNCPYCGFASEKLHAYEPPPRGTPYLSVNHAAHVLLTLVCFSPSPDPPRCDPLVDL